MFKTYRELTDFGNCSIEDIENIIIRKITDFVIEHNKIIDKLFD